MMLNKLPHKHLFSWHNDSPLYLKIGFVIALAIVNLAFYTVPRFYTNDKVIPLPDKPIIPLAPTTIQHKTPPPPVRPAIPVVVDDDNNIDDLDLDRFDYFTDPDKIPHLPPDNADNIETVEFIKVQKKPQLLKKTAPVYPVMARKLGVTGTIACEIIVGKTGRVESVHVINSIPMLDEAAVKAIKQWIFSPGMQRDIPVSVKMTVKLNFRLN